MLPDGKGFPNPIRLRSRTLTSKLPCLSDPMSSASHRSKRYVVNRNQLNRTGSPRDQSVYREKSDQFNSPSDLGLKMLVFGLNHDLI